MNWAGPLALVVMVGILLLPGATPARLGALARGGRLHGADSGRRPAWRPTGDLTTRGFIVAALGVSLALSAVLKASVGIEAAIVLGVAGVLGRDLQRGRAAAARLNEIRSAVGLLESELQAGTPPPAALAAAAEHSPRLADALGGTVLAGGDVVGALTGSGDADLRRLGVTWRVGEATGMPLAEVLATLGSDLRSAADQRRAVSVAVAGPQASAALLCLLPVLGVGLGIAMGARPLGLLFGTPVGGVLTCIGLMLDAGGVLWVRQILRGAQQ